MILDTSFIIDIIQGDKDVLQESGFNTIDIYSNLEVEKEEKSKMIVAVGVKE